LGISSSALIRKWVQVWRKKKNLPAEGYRKSYIPDEVYELKRLVNLNKRFKEERDLVLKILSLLTKGEIDGWEELLSKLRPPEGEI
jgi:transposase-like protein